MSKIRLTFKTPDVAYYALQDIRDEDEREEAEEAIKKFVRNDEYVGIEIDTEAGTAKVLEQ